MKEQLPPEGNRDIALFNADDEFNRAVNEEDIDYNIPGLPHSAVKQSPSTNIQDLIQKMENHPHRHALQSDLHQRKQFNPFRQESKDMIREVGNIELCELLDMEPEAVQNMSVVLGRRHRLLHVRALLARWNGGEQEIRHVHSRSPLDSQILHQEKGDPTGTVTGRSQGITSTSPRIRSRRNARKDISWVSTTGSSVMRSSART